jgi:hypothetical protein
MAAMALAAGGLLITAGPASASHSCSTVSSIQRVDSTHFNHGGQGFCNHSIASLTITCTPIHRHSLSWHTHGGDVVTFPASSNTSSTPAWMAGPVAGTSGDTYKTSCTGDFVDHGSNVQDTTESSTVTL